MFQTQADDKINKNLIKISKEEDERRAQYLAEEAGLPYIDLRIRAPELDALEKISEEDARKYKLAPFKVVDDILHLAIADPGNEEVIKYIINYAKNHPKPIIYITSPASVETVLARYKELDKEEVVERGLVNLKEEHLKLLLEGVNTLNDWRTRLEQIIMSEKRERISRIIEMMCAGAIHFGASDIHIEPEEDKVKTRYRIDGVLQDIFYTDMKTFELMNSRLKLLSGLKLTIRSASQDGRFEIEYNQEKIEVRVSVVPGNYGENYVMRILDPKAANIGFENLGMSEIMLNLLDKNIKKPYGMILNTGPTGSGKSTTLYACLRRVFTTEKKIITIEDPIEYHLEGITQTQVDPKKGYTFLLGLRAALRQDPDIIMIGEIRDEDTAKVASSAALTGHLVFSTLHTNSAVGAINRMIDLGVEVKTLASSLGLVMAQRLCRRLCPYCKIEAESGEDSSKIITDILGNMIIEGKDVPIRPQKVYKLWRANEIGCDKCHFGYKGRIGIFEGVEFTKELEEAALKGAGERELKEIASKQKIPSLREDGIIKLLQGVTSFEELESVVDLYQK